MSVGFLITSPYQVFHYKQIAAHLDDVTVICEARQKTFGLNDELIAEHMPGRNVEWVSEDRLNDLDGRFDVLVCQTPILPLKFLHSSLIVAQQYSLAKERYQYGPWRSHAHLNLMYGPRSTRMVEGFSRAAAVGNPILDPLWQGEPTDRRSFRDGIARPKLMYAPTYGSLSSLSAVLPRLTAVDADITLKLHHAEDGVDESQLPAGFRVVYSDSDPAEQLRYHDGVLSDYSGAAFDAAYAGLPVVLTEGGDVDSDDYDRLSDEERDYSLVAPFGELWRPGTDLLDAFRAAEAKKETPEYSAFIEDTFCNAGKAGESAAREIQDLLENGPRPHFAADQVRETTQRYIETNRQIRGKARESVGANGGDAAVVGHPPSRWPALYQRTRTRLAQVSTLRKVVEWRREHKRNKLKLEPRVIGLTEPRPAYRRDNVWKLLAPRLVDAGIKVAKDSDQVGSVVAIRENDKRDLLRVLQKLAEEYPHLYVRAGMQQRMGKLHELSELAAWELHAADWIEVGGLTEQGTVQRDTSGYLSIQFVSLHNERNRYLETRTIPDRVDWTNLFEQCDTPGVTIPVGEHKPHMAAPVDVVYTWVDSNDPKWQASRQKFGGASESEIVSAANAERYADREELRHSLRTLWMFAPFVRNIFIVTADQHPEWLAKEDPRVKVISHREIFPDESALPTFNSHAIEACLHRIPGLAENFIYFNDDVFLGREVTEEDFFTTAGLAKVRLSPSQYIYEGKPEPDAIPTDWAAYNTVNLVERDFGQHFDRRVKHVPLALKKSVLAEIEKRYSAEIERTRHARFRSRDDLALPSMFAQYYAIMTARAVEWPDPRRTYVYLDTGKHISADRFRWIVDWRPMFYCLNTTRFTQVSMEEQAVNLRRFYRKVLPHAAPWEVSEKDAAADASGEQDQTPVDVGAK